LINWPTFNNQTFPCKFHYERAVWGKVHNTSSDFRWIAASPHFISNNRSIERQFGAEDNPCSFFVWKKQADFQYAVSIYPSQSIDSAGRTGFLEKQFIQWRINSEISDLIAMLVLSHQVSQYNNDIWLDKVEPNLWNNEQFCLPLSVDEIPVLTITEDIIETLIQEGIRELNKHLDQEILGQFYACLLTEQFPAVLKLNKPLPANAFACLFLSLPPQIFSKLSIIGWLPTERFSTKKLKKTWDVIITDQNLDYNPILSAEDIALGESLAQALLDNTPLEIQSNQSLREVVSQTEDPSITLWGPSSSGKTFLLAQLYLQAKSNHSHWEVHPTQNTIDYIDPFRKDILVDNVFPTGTAVGDNNELTFRFLNPENNQQINLNIEDRAGTDYSEHHEEVIQRLMATQGLVILVNPFDKREHQINEVLKMLDDMKVKRGEDIKDARPIAICYTQVDEHWIDTVEALQAAIKEPHQFIKNKLDKKDKILERINLHFTNYKLFPVSAAGLKIQYGTVLHTAFFNEEFTACICPQGDSINLLEPFIWIIEQLNLPKTEENNNNYE